METTATTSRTPVMSPAGEPTKSATLINMRVGSGSSASKSAKNSANLGMANTTMTSTTSIATQSRMTG